MTDKKPTELVFSGMQEATTLFPTKFKCSKCGREEIGYGDVTGITITMEDLKTISFCVCCLARKWLKQGVGVMEKVDELHDSLKQQK